MSQRVDKDDLSMVVLLSKILSNHGGNFNADNMYTQIFAAMKNPKNAKLTREILTKHDENFKRLMTKLKKHDEAQALSDLFSDLNMAEVAGGRERGIGFPKYSSVKSDSGSRGRGAPLRSSHFRSKEQSVHPAVALRQPLPSREAGAFPFSFPTDGNPSNSMFATMPEAMPKRAVDFTAYSDPMIGNRGAVSTTPAASDSGGSARPAITRDQLAEMEDAWYN